MEVIDAKFVTGWSPAPVGRQLSGEVVRIRTLPSDKLSVPQWGCAALLTRTICNGRCKCYTRLRREHKSACKIYKLPVAAGPS